VQGRENMGDVGQRAEVSILGDLMGQGLATRAFSFLDSPRGRRERCLFRAGGFKGFGGILLRQEGEKPQGPWGIGSTVKKKLWFASKMERGKGLRRGGEGKGNRRPTVSDGDEGHAAKKPFIGGGEQKPGRQGPTEKKGGVIF